MKFFPLAACLCALATSCRSPESESAAYFNKQEGFQLVFSSTKYYVGPGDGKNTDDTLKNIGRKFKMVGADCIAADYFVFYAKKLRPLEESRVQCEGMSANIRDLGRGTGKYEVSMKCGNPNLCPSGLIGKFYFSYVINRDGLVESITLDPMSNFPTEFKAIGSGKWIPTRRLQ